MEESRKKANRKWLAKNYETIKIRVPKGPREKIKKWAAAHNMSMEKYICSSCEEKAEK